MYHVPSFWMARGRVATGSVGSQVMSQRSLGGGAGEVEGDDLQVAAVEEAVVGDDGAFFFAAFAVGGDGFGFLEDAASHVVVVGGDDGAGAVPFFVGVGDGAVEGVVGGRPDAGGGFDAGLVAVRQHISRVGRSPAFVFVNHLGAFSALAKKLLRLVSESKIPAGDKTIADERGLHGFFSEGSHDL